MAAPALMYAEVQRKRIPEQKIISDEEMGNQTTGSRRMLWLAKVAVAAGLVAALVAASIGMIGARRTTVMRAAGVLGLSEDSREINVDMARVAEQAGRYEDMVEFMKKVVMGEGPLVAEERNLFSVANKNVVGELRSAWRVVDSLIAKKEDSGGDTSHLVHYRKTIQEELAGKVNEVLDLIDTEILPKDKGNHPEAKIFFLKMQGDYSRYLAEVSKGDARTDLVDKSEAFYKEAMEAAKDLPSTNPIGLGLALNYAVFQHDIKGDTNDACRVAKEAFDSAIADDDLKEDNYYEDSTLIMQLLRDHLNLWTCEQEEHKD